MSIEIFRGRQWRLAGLVAAAMVSLLLERDAAAQAVPLAISQNSFLYNTLLPTNQILNINWQSQRGVPLTTNVNIAIGSDGRAPTIAQQTSSGLPTAPPTTNQFRGFVSMGAIPTQAHNQTNLIANASFVANAESLDWPRGKSGAQLVVVLRAAQVGANFFSKPVSFAFGDVIPVPIVDAHGVQLTNISPQSYWLPAPYTTNNYTNAPYYFSPHAQAVFAVQAGQISITWQAASPFLTLPADYVTTNSQGMVTTNYALQQGYYYPLYTQTYIVSGAATKPPQKMYWTEGVFQNVGQPVSVPADRVSLVNVIYNNTFLRRVAQAYVDPGEVPVVDTNALTETRTLWYDINRKQILAYNVEGRVFVELLGELHDDNKTRRFLGFEIVDVSKQAAPQDITVNIGDRVFPYQDHDDPNLYPSPLISLGQPFYFQKVTAGSGKVSLFAVRETQNLNDFECHWLITGVAGLQWPFVFDRYKEVWPADPALYSFYLRPLVPTDAEARQTAIQLPTQNAPLIQYQDPLDTPRAHLTETFSYYTFLDAAHPAHRGLLRYTSGEEIAFERIFSLLDVDLKSPALFTGSLATNIMGWNSTNMTYDFHTQLYAAPYVTNLTVNVGDRISAPPGEKGSDGDYFAGHIRQTNGNSFDINAYIDPITQGYSNANMGAIIPVNAISNRNTMEVWWFRQNNADASKGFLPSYWPSVIGHYTLQWPSNAKEIVLASGAGSGGLPSLQAKGTIYFQNDPALAGYNPNEEHALMLGGQAFALRDDLNITTQTNNEYSSAPYVLVDYTESDNRPAVAIFKVRREAPERNILFDYVTEAGTLLQAPMPLPFLDKPVVGTGASAVNYNTEPPGSSGDLPPGWDDAIFGGGSLARYRSFTFQDRKNNFWVYRGLHSGLPALATGTYNPTNNTFGPLPAATAVIGSPFNYYIHASRRPISLVLNSLTTLPAGLQAMTSTNGLVITGIPMTGGSNTFTLTIQDTGDGSTTTNMLSMNVVTNGFAVAQTPLAITSSNQYSHAIVTYTNRPPQLAQAAAPSNSFTMRFYYRTQNGFAWPGIASPPAVGSIVPYLRPLNPSGGFVGNPASSNTPSLDIVYRPVWPATPPTLFSAQTLTDAKNGLAAVRGQNSVRVIYQQSIAQTINSGQLNSVLLHDPTRQKLCDLAGHGLTKIPDSIRTDNYQGRIYFPNLPPHLAQRVYVDPNMGSNGTLVLMGQYVDDPVGEKYLMLNVLRGQDLKSVEDLCPVADTVNRSKWLATVDGLNTRVQTFYENPNVPGQYIANTNLDVIRDVGAIPVITDSDTAVDSYAMSASGPGQGYITYVTGDGRAFTPAGAPISVYIARVVPPLYTGQLKVLPSANPLNELLTMQHSVDVGGNFDDYQYDWRILPPVDGLPPTSPYDTWTTLTNGIGAPRVTLGGAGIQTLVDNYVVMRYRNINPFAPPAVTNWSEWSAPQLAEGWIKRVLAGINPFNQRTTDLFNNIVNTDASLLQQAGHRWEGDIALNLDTINNFGLIEIYETVLRRGESLSINNNINFGPANDALLLASGYLDDLYMELGNEAWADASDPTISIGTTDATLGNVATALFAFKGQEPTLLEENLALLRGRDDFLQPGVTLGPAYNRLYWNYTRGIDSGEVIYALNYNISDINGDGAINAADAVKLYPQAHGDAYGHYLTALNNYYRLLMNPNFDWVPRIEAVTILGAVVSVDYQDERKFAAAAAALARTGQQVFDLTWKNDYEAGTNGWSNFGKTRVNNQRTYVNGGVTNNITRYWGMDHWASRVGQGDYINWVVGNAILPPVDPDPNHEGIQKVDRMTVPELTELTALGDALQTDMNNAEAGLNPLGLSPTAIPFDINPAQVTGANPVTHFEQIFQRAISALNNAVVAFNDAKGVNNEMRSKQNSLADFLVTVNNQELAYTNQLIGLYGTPYPDDSGPGKTYKQGYDGPDYYHYMYVETPDSSFNGGLADPMKPQVFKIDITQFPTNYDATLYTNFDFSPVGGSPTYTNYVTFEVAPHGFFGKPATWTSQRKSPGEIQQAISEFIRAHDALDTALVNAAYSKSTLDKSVELFKAQVASHQIIKSNANIQLIATTILGAAQFAGDVYSKFTTSAKSVAQQQAQIFSDALPKSLIFGLAAGGDSLAPARAAIEEAGEITSASFDALDFVQFFITRGLAFSTATSAAYNDFNVVEPMMWTSTLQQSVANLGLQLGNVQGQLATINQQIRGLDDAKRKYQAIVAKGDRIQQERQVFRQHAAAVIQGYRTRDAAFRVFRNEKLERYKSLFDLAAKYSFLAAQAYDYETGLLNTPQGRSFLSRIASSQALGVISGGQPQYAGSDTGDPGLSSALAEMKADFDVLKGRLGFNNPDGYGTTMSLRGENYRILPGSDGDANWKDVMQQGRMANILTDQDVKRYCLQIDNGNGQPVPGIVITFSTVISDGLNFFGKQLAAGDHYFTPSSFATKVFSIGVDFDGYIGMDNPNASGGISPADPSLDPNALAATPYVYLIPCGVDSMRSPPLGDASAIRTWNVDDVTIPLPFNISAADFSSAPNYGSANSLTEPLFAIRKHQSFRPVSTTAAFSAGIYGGGALQRTQFTNSRLIGRSVWNSRWKLVIPGRALLNDPNAGLDHFQQTVKDVKIYLITYSYSGN